MLSFMVKALYFQSSVWTNNCQVEMVFKWLGQSCTASAALYCNLSALAENFQLYNLFFNVLKICVLNSCVTKSWQGYSVHVHIELKMQIHSENLHNFCLIYMHLNSSWFITFTDILKTATCKFTHEYN